ncbi:UDP-glucose 4-epimerase GalE [Thiohalocapsa marina]|uniref:UDP-glucose 4-epimerase n=1 Tax=Thiohalocapsa marina TaxID=424902 RepID=A0A5M8FGG9_9GAMM|nr:UDP-glucose 4-epimerase GalE [Thiohalocapsa marina]KAA6183963.1 UDP-glucose 4-epimerase GalE [Thiohalocapsa marina]
MTSSPTKSVLVTGGAGYIGSHACKALAQAGYQPVACDNLVYGHPWAVKWGPLEQGDIADRAWLDALIARYRPVAVMHFAAYAYVGESVQDPGKYYRNNVAGTLTLLEALRDHQVRHCIFSSTCATYGVPAVMPIDEATPQAPINPYGASKWMIERILADFEVAHGLRSLSLRYFNAAGADPDGEIGEEHAPETHLIPLAIQAAQRGEPALAIFGTDYDTPDGTAVRDYIHVTDLAVAHVKALEDLLAGGASGALNLGTGQGYSVREVVEAVEVVSGRPVPVREAARRVGDPPVLVADPRRAMQRLDWQPRYSSLSRIVETAWGWHAGR